MRTLTAPALALLASGNIKPVYFVEMQTAPVLRLNSTPVDIVHGGFTWQGAGLLGSIEAINDKAGEFQSLRLTLSGITQDAITLALSEDIRAKACIIYLALLDTVTEAVVDVSTLWTGSLDRMQIQQTPPKNGSPGIVVIGVEAIHAGEKMQRPRPLRFTAEDTAAEYGGDTSGRFLVSQATEQLAWPAASYFKK